MVQALTDPSPLTSFIFFNISNPRLNKKKDTKNFSKNDYWICFIHTQKLIIKNDKMFCPIPFCNGSCFIRKSYWDILKKFYKNLG